jgi:uncharacterized protein (DUF1778 family)
MVRQANGSRVRQNDVQYNYPTLIGVLMTRPSQKSQRLGLRIDADLKQKVEYAAKLKGVGVAGYAKSVLAAAAAKDIEEQEFLSLSLDDRIAFAQAILQPIEPSKKSIVSARAYKERFGL